MCWLSDGYCSSALVLSHEADSPATVGQGDGDGAEQQIAFGLADDGLTVCSGGDDQKLLYPVPVSTNTVTESFTRESQLIIFCNRLYLCE